MSVSFFGWEVTYDDASPRSMSLGAAQEPKNRGVYTMYHGTTVASARQIIPNGFKPSADGRLGKGVYVSRDKAKAEQYPFFCLLSGRVVLILRVRVGRVKRIDMDNHPLQKTWSAQGYNTAWFPPTSGSLEEDCVFDPNRVEVVGIAKAPDSTVQAELEQLIANNPKKHRRGGGRGSGDVCSVCKGKKTKDHPHDQELCWSCGHNICVLMPKHFCPVQAAPQRA